MKDRDITYGEVEQLFNQIIERDPLVSEEEVNSMLFNLPVTKSSGSIKHFFSNRLNTLLISAATLLICLTATLFWINYDNKNLETLTNIEPQKNTIFPVTPDTIATDTVKSLDTITIEKQDIDARDLNEVVAEVNPIVAEVDIVSLADVLKYHEKKSQIFNIRPDRDTTIIGEEGTSIKITANSFVAEKTGEIIDGNVQIAVKEYYKLSDIVLANLSTTSGEKLLETGGMLYVSAKAGDEDCTIKPGSDIQIGFPYANNKEGMILFNGEWINDKIDWQPADELVNDDVTVMDVLTSAESEMQIFFIVEEMPEFPGGDVALRKYIEQNAIVPYSVLKDSVKGKVQVEFIIDRFGATRDIRVVQSLNETLDKAAVYLFSKMPRWKPGKQRGRSVNVHYTVRVDYAPRLGELSPEEINQAKDLDEKVKELKYDIETSRFYRNSNEFKDFEKSLTKGKFEEIDAGEVNRYIFSSTQLGWLNVDRFYKESKSLTNISIMEDKPEETMVTVIFHGFKAIARGKVESGKITFRSVPVGEKITIVSVQTEGNKIYLAVKETEITKNKEMVLDYKKVTMKLLKEKMEELDKYGF